MKKERIEERISALKKTKALLEKRKVNIKMMIVSLENKLLPFPDKCKLIFSRINSITGGNANEEIQQNKK